MLTILFLCTLIVFGVPELHAQSMQQVLPRSGDPGEYYFYDIACSDDHNCTIPTVRYDTATKKLTLHFERTTDGGLTWVQQPSPFPDQTYHFQEWKWSGAYAIDSLRILAYGDSGKVAITTDAGQSWIDASLKDYRNISSMSFSDKVNGMLTGGGGQIRTTTDGGLTWDTVAGLPFKAFTSGHAFSQSNMTAYSPSMARIFSTSDEWSSFDTLKRVFDPSALLGDTAKGITQLRWLSRDTVVGIGSAFFRNSNPTIKAPYVSRSTDGGKSWADVFLSDTYLETVNDVSFHPSGVGLIVGRLPGLLMTTDWGRTWIEDSIETDVSFTEISDVAMLTPTIALMDLSVLNFGKIFRVNLEQLSVKARKGKVRLGTHLYPNPSSGVLSITKWYSYEEDVRIIDIFGRTVLATKINREPGTSTIDCSHLPNGTYTVLIKYEGSDLPVGRFVLMK